MKNNMTKEQKILFNRIFIDIEVDGNIKYSQITFIKRRFKNIDVESIGMEIWMKLIDKGIDFNWTYFRMKLISGCQKAYNKETIRLKRETKGLNIGDIITDMNQPPVVEPPEIAWKEPLTKSEKRMVDYLIEGLTQREIYSKYKIHPQVQVDLRKAIKEKMEVT